ncbi:unnamed protein product [Calypogeia fissa]
MAAKAVLSSCAINNQALSFAEWRNTTEISRAQSESVHVFASASSCRQQRIISFNGQRRRRTLPLARDGDYYSGRTGGTLSRARELWRLVPNASVTEEQEQKQKPETTSSPTLKDFLEDLKPVGRVRLIVNTGVAVLESVTSFEKFYYHAGPRGEYANIMSREENVDFHLLLEKVALVRLVQGKTKSDIPTYMVRLVDVNDSNALSVLVMWRIGTDGEYDPGQVEAFQALLEKYGEEYKFPSS